MSENEDVWKKVCKECGSEFPDHQEDCKFNPDKDKWKIVGEHKGCGGNIIKRRQCSKCDKCGEYFCGCATS